MKENWKIITLVILTVLALVARGDEDDTLANGGEDNAAASQTEEKGGVKKLRLTAIASASDSGLMDYLRQPLLDDIDIEIETVSKGSGAAIEDGRQGNADVALVHSPKAEKEFAGEGLGMDRISFMRNYFVIVGPKDDPAKIVGKQAEEALKLTNDTKAPFVSRGDESGTHKKELTIWERAGPNPEDLKANENYNSLGGGMDATLKFANEKQGYALTDLATFLSMEKDLNLKILADQSEVLKNACSIILINFDKAEGANTEPAKGLQDWMTSKKAVQLIDKYGVEEYGQQLLISGE